MLRTTSQVLSHHSQLEEAQSSYYDQAAKELAEHADLFLSHSKESQRQRDMAQRAYREGVTDAFEVGFLAEPLDPDDYSLSEPVGSLSETVETLIGNEHVLVRFCEDVASGSSELIPDLPETFERIVKRKKRNIRRLEEL